MRSLENPFAQPVEVARGLHLPPRGFLNLFRKSACCHAAKVVKIIRLPPLLHAKGLKWTAREQQLWIKFAGKSRQEASF